MLCCRDRHISGLTIFFPINQSFMMIDTNLGNKEVIKFLCPRIRFGTLLPMDSSQIVHYVATGQNQNIFITQRP